MSEASVTVINTVATVVVENVTSGATATVETQGEIVVVIEQVGIQGPPGNGGDLDPNFIIDGGNF